MILKAGKCFAVGTRKMGNEGIMLGPDTSILAEVLGTEVIYRDDDPPAVVSAKVIAKIQPGYGNTAPMQWELDPTFATTDNIELIKSIITTHFDLGGTLINVNIMDKDKILDAHKNPSNYPDLVVRVTGFTAYFSMLSPQFRQLVVDRILES